MTMPGQRLGAPERKGLAGFESAPTECLLPGQLCQGSLFVEFIASVQAIVGRWGCQ